MCTCIFCAQFNLNEHYSAPYTLNQVWYWSARLFPWLSLYEYLIGFAPATVTGVSFSSEFSYDTHVPKASLFAIYDVVHDTRNTCLIRFLGGAVVDTMCLKKRLLYYKLDILTEFDPFKTVLDRFVIVVKLDFSERDALLYSTTSVKCFITMHVDYDSAPTNDNS